MFSRRVRFNELDFFASGEFHEYRAKERLRILIHISLEITGKTLSDKTE